MCLNNEYSANGFNVTEAETGTAGQVIERTNPGIGANGCDSTTVLHLTVKDTTLVHIYDEVCLNNEYSANGFNVTEAETSTAGQVIERTNPGTGINGCDSTTVLHLTVNPIDSVPFVETICAGETYNEYGFFYEAPYSTTPSVHYDTLRTINAYGCDSTVTLHLTILPVDSISFTEDLCAGHSYNGHGFSYDAPLSVTPYVHHDTIRTVNVHAAG